MITLSGDFETRSRVDLKKSGVSVYARHESTDVLCLAISVNGAAPGLWFPAVGGARRLDSRQCCPPMPKAWREAVEGGALFYAFNAPFERYIWHWIMHKRYGWPDIPLDRWRCTRAKALHASVAGDMEKVSRLLNPRGKAKSDTGRKLMLRMSKPTRGSYVDDVDSHHKLREYCKQDVVAESAANERLPGFPSAEQAVWLQDRIINERGVPVDLDLCRAAVGLLAEAKLRADREISMITEGVITAPSQVARITKWLHERGVNVDNLRAPTVEALLRPEELGGLDEFEQADARRVVQLRADTSSAAVKKYGATLAWSDVDERARETIQYYAAGTGRYGGRGPQFQNMKRGGRFKSEADMNAAIAAVKTRDYDLVESLYGNVVHTLAHMVRSIIVAPDGKRLVISDFAGIEARVLAWLAGHAELVGLFASGADIYKDMACKIYDVKIEDADWKSAKGKEMRQIGKIAILGLGYGMGSLKFVLTAFVMGGVTITDDFAATVVAKYREANKPIVKFWYGLEKAVVECIKTKKPAKVGRYIHVDMKGEYLRIGLPSGRRLYYFKPRLKPSDKFEGAESITYLQRGARIDTYGGKLVENVVQAVSRCLLVDAMRRTDQALLPIIAHVHDEIVCEVDETKAPAATERLQSIMSTGPSWAAGLPLGAEAYHCRRYTK